MLHRSVLSRIKRQRSALISTSKAYRMVSHAALCVLTGTMPIHIRAQWRGKIYVVRKKPARPDLGDSEAFLNQLHLYDQETAEEWRREWVRSNTNNWTRRLIEDAAIFRKRKRSMDHYTMQLLTGYGIFNTYRVRINKETVDKCRDCVACPNDAEHALLRSPRWADQRTILENVVGDTLTMNNIIVLVSADDHT